MNPIDVFATGLGTGFAVGAWVGYVLRGGSRRAEPSGPTVTLDGPTRQKRSKPTFVSLPNHTQRTVIPLNEPTARRVPAVAVDVGRDDVVAALTALGFKKVDAVKAVDACEQGERSSVEMWIAASLRRAVRT